MSDSILKRLRWGLLGTGNIARQFATGVKTGYRAVLAAVGSRSEQSARAFAAAHSIPISLPSYDALLASRDIDAVYISLPNSMHHEWTLKALSAGKHVLCEKPIAASATQAAEMFDAAQRAGLILIEAFMYRAHPLTDAVCQAVRSGAVGQLKLIRSSFCYRTARIDGNIRFDPSLAGGALMDIGCYCINLSRLLAGQPPSALCVSGHLHPSGIDDFAAGTLAFPNGILASFTCGMTVQADNTAYICGDEGYIEIPIPWKPPAQDALYIISRSTPPRMDSPGTRTPTPAVPPRQVHKISANVELYGLESDDFAATVLDGKAPMMSSQESIENMRVLDEMRRQIGVRF